MVDPARSGVSITEALLKDKRITREQLRDAEDKRLGARRPIHEVLIDMGFLSEEDYLKSYSTACSISAYNLDKEKKDPAVLKLLSYKTAKMYGAFPLRLEGRVLVVAMGDPLDLNSKEELETIAEHPIQPILASKTAIGACINEHYQANDQIYEILKNIATLSEGEIADVGGQLDSTVVIDQLADDDSPAVQLVSFILSDALKNRVSDIHLEAQESGFVVRERIDGEMKEIATFAKSLHPQIISRIKIMSNLNIAEHRQAQDGRARISADGRDVDLRISIVPTIHGEKAVIRILDFKEAKIQIKDIGLDPPELELFMRSLSKPNGMILVTGPTGSGKTSTLYAALNHLKLSKKNIVTLEDPVEYMIDGLSQIPVNPIKNITFASGLRSILRQDPDIVLIGEIRDKETADMAAQAALTGRLVFSTLHTKNAASSITRLFDIGLEPYLVASSVVLVVAQRLVKVICGECKTEHAPDPKLLEKYRVHIDELGIQKFHTGKGCRRCRFTGFYGRTAIFEIFEVNDAMRSLIAARASDDELFKEARKIGFKSLAQSGMRRVAQGVTSLEELARVAEVWEIDERMHQLRRPGANIRVLAAEDDEGILEVLVSRLEMAGYEVIKARDGEELVEKALKHHPDIIITDVTMPKMNGFEATSILKKNLETASIPIMILTARQDKESELAGLDAGADDYLCKPFDKDKLIARMKLVLKHHQL
jgi:type IV pilus assembly protein PilB